MERYMAEFGQDGNGQGFVQAAVLSENNAVKYRLSIAGSCTQSTVPPYIKFQDSNLPVVFAAGLNVFVFDTTTLSIIETKSYNFTNVPSDTNRAFMTYMASLPKDKLVLFVSDKKLRTCVELVDWFKKRNSTAWPSVWDINTFDVAYSAFFITSMDSVTSEHSLCNDGVVLEPISTHLDLVWDYFSDIGATGVPSRIAEVDKELASNTNEATALIRLPTSQLESPLSDYNLKAGDLFYLKFSSMVGVGTGPGPRPNGTTRCSIRWFNNGVMTSSQNIDASSTTINLNKWQQFNRYIKVPPNVTAFTIYFFKTDAADYGAVKNITVSEVPREETPMFRAAEFGVNGIRMNLMIDGAVDELLVLNDSETDDRGQVRSTEFRELQ